MSCSLALAVLISFFFFFFNDTATTEIYTLSLHDALPIFLGREGGRETRGGPASGTGAAAGTGGFVRSEEHTSELQSRLHLVCRLLLEKKKKHQNNPVTTPTDNGRKQWWRI